MASSPITPVQFRAGDVHTDSPVALQNLNTFLRQTQTVAAAGVAAPSWVQMVTFSNGWGPFDGFKAQYAQLPNGQVVFNGALAGGTLAAAAFTLPSALWPTQDKNFAVESAGAYGKITISAGNGALTPVVGNTAFFSLDGMAFWPNS